MQAATSTSRLSSSAKKRSFFLGPSTEPARQGAGIGGRVLYFNIPDFRRHHAVNTRARSYRFGLDEFFGITHRAGQRRTNQKNEGQTVQAVQSLRSVKPPEPEPF
jgi:hypothetical protein